MTAPTRRTFLSLAAVTAVGAVLAGCSRGSTSTGEALDAPIEGGRTLVTYFSVPLTDRPEGMDQDEENSTHVVDGKVYGNVQYFAQLIEARLGAEVFRIETAEDLPTSYQPLADLALEQQEAGTRPELKGGMPDLAEFDTVFIGYPIFWYDIPMPLYSFLEQTDFSGKNIVLFSVHGGSQLSGSVETITEALPDATVSKNAFSISRDDMDDSEPQLREWLDSL
ncbi:flavodoxin [Curtobacterium sp. SL109]|uniref:flavodoxin n=1 Tax=Curtobacterium sp. SL109 TaxID=2994662 RepID=UPI002276F686|nr:flavodoxin [Curtobacterium sp. SL109]MCY1692868.1 flavodoxin [Curtobacterium sp. SL109]